MNKILSLIALGSVCMLAPLSAKEAPAQDSKKATADSEGFQFTDIKILPHTPVKDQNKSGTCWCFAGCSLMESDVLRKGGEELDLSEMYYVRQNYIDKAKKYMRMDGKINFAQGGSFGDVNETAKIYGAIPEEVYQGLNYGEDKHSHYEMADALKGYLDGILGGKRKLSDAWLSGFTAILDAYLGPVPEEFTYKGQTYTPQSFAEAYGIAPEEFINITSFTHHPFYTSFPIEVADNWRWNYSYNIPLDEFKQLVDYALDHGYTIGWSADVSEPTFKWKDGIAVLPAEKTVADMTDAEVAKWTHLSNKERQELANETKGPVKERTITQESRQKGFDNHETTDDHAMEIVGIAKDQKGNRYYKVKNSWDTNQIYDGYLYVSEPYFMEKTLNVQLNRNAIPEDLQKKLGI